MTQTDPQPRSVGSLAPARKSTTAADQAADEWAEEAIANRLPRLREAAGKWQTAVASLTGLFGAGSVLNADTAIRALETPYRIGYGIAVVLALCSSGVALAYTSAASSYELMVIGPSVSERRNLEQRTFDSLRKRFLTSHRLMLIAGLLLLISFLIRWFGPTIASTK